LAAATTRGAPTPSTIAPAAGPTAMPATAATDRMTPAVVNESPAISSA
jgi:hypothetical protein